jgi:hypothetical protein
MSYDTRVLGEITITPPLPYPKIRQSPFRSTSRDKTTTVLMFVEDNRVEDTDEGTLSRATGVGIKAREEGPEKHYGMDVELTKIVEDNPGHQFEGELIIIGADPGDIKRLRVERAAGPGRGMHARVVTDTAELRWPDGSKIEF